VITRPAEIAQVHTRILRCALEVEDSRAYWQHAEVGRAQAPAQQAFTEFWFGARSLARIHVLLANFRARFDAYPEALRVLTGWTDMDPGTRRLVCHWHLQLADPLYRAFTGRFLPQRHERPKPDMTRDLAVAWVGEQAEERWTTSTRIQFGSKLLSAAFSAGLVASNHDPRALQSPPVGDEALTYLMYLLREVDFAGTLLENPYTASVGLRGPILEDRLRRLDALRFHRQGDVVDFGWRYADLCEWADDHNIAGATVHSGVMR
jgi:hypothetical protein